MKFDFVWSFVTGTAGGAYSVPLDLLAGFKGSYFLGKGGKRRGTDSERGKGKVGREECMEVPNLPLHH